MEETFHLVVDFSHLLPGGANGGVKPFFFELMGWLSAQREFPLRITYLTRSSSHHEVRDLCQENTTLLCVRQDSDRPLDLLNIGRPREGSIDPGKPAFLANLKPDALYCPFGSPEFAAPGVPTICFVADLLHRDYPASLPPSEIAHRERIFRAIADRAQFIQCNSIHVIERMAAHYGTAKERMFFTYNAIHHRLPRSSHRKPATAESPYFLYPANSWIHKNHETLFIAFAAYCARAGESAWSLLLTGHEDERMAGFRNIVGAIRLEKKVRFLGHIPASEFSRVWSGAGALVFPSLHEGFGIPPLEAMHFRIPVICSGEGSLPEVVGDAALIVDCKSPDLLADAMLRIANDASLRKDLVEKGRRRLKGFSLPTEARKLLRAIRNSPEVMVPASFAGVYEDGWTESQAVLSLPRDKQVWRVVLRFNPIPVERRVRIFRGTCPFGGYEIPPAVRTELVLEMEANGEPLVLDIPDAQPIAPPDLRRLGVHLNSVSAARDNEPVWHSWPLSQ